MRSQLEIFVEAYLSKFRNTNKIRQERNSLIRARDMINNVLIDPCCPIINYELIVQEGALNPSLTIYINGIQKIQLTVAGSGSFVVPIGSLIRVVLNNDGTNCGSFEVSQGNDSVSVDCDDTEFNGCIDGSFVVANANEPYLILGEAFPDGEICGE